MLTRFGHGEPSATRRDKKAPLTIPKGKLVSVCPRGAAQQTLHGRVAQYRAAQYRAGQTRAGQYRAGQTRAGQYRAGQYRAGQYRALSAFSAQPAHMVRQNGCDLVLCHCVLSPACLALATMAGARKAGLSPRSVNRAVSRALWRKPRLRATNGPAGGAKADPPPPLRPAS